MIGVLGLMQKQKLTLKTLNLVFTLKTLNLELTFLFSNDT
jgi:hypothetical protein